MIRLNPAVLDNARRLKGFTSDEQLAREMGLSGTTIRNLRHGRTSPDLKTALKIARFAGVPMEGILLESSEVERAAA